jgi:CheY-like chemotaxis protein
MDDGPDLRRQVRESLASAAGCFEIAAAAPGPEALACAAEARAKGRDYAVVFAVPGPPPARHGLQALARLREDNPLLDVIVCGEAADCREMDAAAAGMGGDGCLFLTTPLESGTVRHLALLLARKSEAARQARLELERCKSLLAAEEGAGRAAQEQYRRLFDNYANERSGLEAQLRQAQQMESAGRLAGGIAHDFNNLLTVISGHAGMLMAGPPVSAKAADSLKEIAAATKRASDLTRQLMTFSRKKEPQIQTADPNATGSNAGKSVPPAMPCGEQKEIGGTETILLVEDEAPLLKLMHHILESHGYKVLDSSTGKGALEIWERHEKRIDLLLSDLILPDGMGGQELARRLQSEDPGLKVIYTSGYDPARLSGDFPPAEGAAFIQKPFHARKLAEIVFDTLRQP